MQLESTSLRRHEVTMTVKRPRAARLRSQRGAALVELAIALPLLAVILVGTIEFGQAFRTATITMNAARAGAQYGSQSLARSADLAGMTSARDAVFAANAVPPGAASPPVRSCACANDAGILPGPVSCTAPCPAGQHLAVTVTVTAAATFTLVQSWAGLPSSVSITRASTMRVLN